MIPLPYCGSGQLTRPLAHRSLLEKRVRRLEPTFFTLLACGLIHQAGKVELPWGQWLLTPLILVVLATLGIRLQGWDRRQVGWRLDHWPRALREIAVFSGVTFALTLAVFWLARATSLMAPPQIITEASWPAWFTYQLLYIAPSEELFFRGYVLNRLLNLSPGRRVTLKSSIPALLISSALFALAHWLIVGGWFSWTTFLPSLVLGWLFIRTRSLPAVIAYHVLANVFYVMATCLIW